MKYSLLIVILLTQALFLPAQKPVIDTSTFGKWASTGPIMISNDGHYVLYTIDNMPAGSSTLFIKSLDSAWHWEFPGATRGVFTTDSKRAVFMTTGDSLAFLLLGGGVIQYIRDVNSFQVPKEGLGEWMVYRRHASVGKLVLHNWRTNRDITYDSVSKYLISPHGTALLVEKEDRADRTYPHDLNWVNVQDGNLVSIWDGTRTMNWVFDDFNGQAGQAAFLEEDREDDHVYYTIFYYRPGMSQAAPWLTDSCRGLDAGLTFNQWEPFYFSRNGDRLFFSLTRKKHTTPPLKGVKVDVWSYTGEPRPSVKLESQQQEFYQRSRSFAAMARVGDTVMMRLEQDNENLDDSVWRYKDGHALLLSNDDDEGWNQKTSLPAAWMVSSRDGSRILLKDFASPRSLPYLTAPSSPQDKWFIWFDGDRKTYISYELATGISRNISRKIPVSLTTRRSEDLGQSGQNEPAGMGPWLANDSAVFLYDDYDIWQVDPAGDQSPVNITHGYGRKHHLKFRLLLPDSANFMGLTLDSTLLLSAFDPVNKLNGFYRIDLDRLDSPLNRPVGKHLDRSLDKYGDPVLLNMEPCLQAVSGTQTEDINLNSSFKPVKARDANVWIVQKMTASESPNYFVTKDFFATFQPLTDIHPEREYNWLSTELIDWNLPDGQSCQGILYKPENFNPYNKYPLIFSIYEQFSDNLNHFIAPQIMIGTINIPWFVSRGYLVFVPDIHYRIGYPGKSALDAVVSATKYLSKQPWVNSEKLGITGHSFGGYETNYIITHTHLFAAAAEASGLSDLIRFYAGLKEGDVNARPYFETGQGRIGTTLKNRPDLYIENSPIFKADQVTTPILMMHNTGDPKVPFEQGAEFFTGLRRLGKKAWILHYDGGSHELRSMSDALDYSIRLTQFFDHYLKDAPTPIWMTEGVLP